MPVTKLKRSTSNNNAMLDQNVRSCFKQNPTQLAATSADFSYPSDLAQDSYVASTATTNPATANYWNIAAIIACYRFDLFSCAFSAVGEFCATKIVFSVPETLTISPSCIRILHPLGVRCCDWLTTRHLFNTYPYFTSIVDI